MQISVVCGTRANNYDLLLGFLECLEKQTFTDFDILIVCDRHFSKKEESDFFSFFKSKNLKIFDNINFYTHNNSDFNEKHTGGASYVRNFGINKSEGTYIQLFDDDNRFSETFLEDELKKRNFINSKGEYPEFLIHPTLYYRDTDIIQNQGFSYFDYAQSRPIINTLKNKDYDQIQMFSGNGIFGLAKTIKKTQYDEQIARICEDLDYTMSLSEKGVCLFVFGDLHIHHLEREKTKLEQAWIGSYAQAKQKSRNWFLFIHKHGNKKQIFQFYCIGLWGCLIWLSIKAILYGGKSCFKIIHGLYDGVKEGYQLTHH